MLMPKGSQRGVEKVEICALHRFSQHPLLEILVYRHMESPRIGAT
jgi:hypothetical protein